MANIEFQFSHRFEGTVWNTLADGGNERLFLEIRDAEKKTASFSSLNVRNNQWLWKDVVFDEPWWVSLRAVQDDILLLTVYADTGNPDRKSVIAFHVTEQRMVWWRNRFAVTHVNHRYVMGTDERFPGKESVLDLFTGADVSRTDFDLEDMQNFPVIRPFQYREGTSHFDTVRDFLRARWGVSPVVTIEYLEFQSLIIMSVFLKENGLANYLYVLSDRGDLLVKEKLGEDLSGVGLDTFYVYSGHLIFVRNKNELTSFRIT